jgi:hypothetical protein
MDILSHLQQVLEDLHAVRVDLDVCSYVVDEETRRELPGARQLPEQLFVREAADGVELALFIDPAVLESLERDHPQCCLHAGNLESYCIAVEGVSHFILVAWRAQRRWPVTALELEIQAEVDKFVSAWLLLADQGRPRHVAAQILRRRLFHSYSLQDDVPPEEGSRYHVASQVAERFCSRLARRFGRDPDHQRIRRDVREFYRRGLSEKLRAA